MHELKSISKIGLAVGCYSIISGITSIILLYERLDKLMMYFKNIDLDNETIVSFFYSLVLIILSAAMIYGIFKRQHTWLIVWLIGHSIMLVSFGIIMTQEINSRGFYMYTFIQSVRVAGEGFFTMFTIYILYQEMRWANAKEQELQDKKNDENKIELEEI